MSNASATLILAHAWGTDARTEGLDRTTLDDDREAVRAIRDAAHDEGAADAYTVDERAIRGAWLMGYAGAGLDESTECPACHGTITATDAHTYRTGGQHCAHTYTHGTRPFCIGCGADAL